MEKRENLICIFDGKSATDITLKKKKLKYFSRRGKCRRSVKRQKFIVCKFFNSSVAARERIDRRGLAVAQKCGPPERESVLTSRNTVQSGVRRRILSRTVDFVVRSTKQQERSGLAENDRPTNRRQSPSPNMFALIVLWLLIAIVVIWALVDTVGRVSRALWEILIPIFDSSTVDLKTKFGDWAVVTGSTDGIGKAYAKELASRGMNLVLISRTLDRLEKTKNEILETNPKIEVRIIVADFAKGREIYDEIAMKLADVPIGILVNNVGKQYSYPMYVGEVPENELWDIININVGATTLMTRKVIAGMQKRGRGAIVNVSSGSELQPLPLMTVYAATKIYLRSFSEALRAEYEKFGITVQHLTPLFVNTKMNAFSDRLQVSSIFVPDAETYARNAVVTLGKIDTSTGYWAHGVQHFFTLIPPVWIRTKIGQMMNQSFRNDYFKRKSL